MLPFDYPYPDRSESLDYDYDHALATYTDGAPYYDYSEPLPPYPYTDGPDPELWADTVATVRYLQSERDRLQARNKLSFKRISSVFVPLVCLGIYGLLSLMSDVRGGAVGRELGSLKESTKEWYHELEKHVMKPRWGPAFEAYKGIGNPRKLHAIRFVH